MVSPPEEYDALVTVGRYGTPVREGALCRAFNLAKEAARAKGVSIPQTAAFRDLRHFIDAVLIASGVAPRSVPARMLCTASGHTEHPGRSEAVSTGFLNRCTHIGAVVGGLVVLVCPRPRVWRGS
ncbi:hypothetical protein GCM10017557_53430 [Streptomyces aurantiacus]|uniref:Uncharacterized protein n=1 Tax=Streptomyces aurantiacus TaxID=47760 RepID=A0A7G1P9B3_9ACTN|nr:hypothetical protein GCM10017557_53430 [Streptomyces aurantiacus]